MRVHSRAQGWSTPVAAAFAIAIVSAGCSDVQGPAGPQGVQGPLPTVALGAGLTGTGATDSPLAADFGGGGAAAQVARADHDHDARYAVDEGLGQSAANPGRTCEDILVRTGATTDGTYWIDPRHRGAPFQVHCDMTTDGGGWTIVYATPAEVSGQVPMVSDTEFTASDPSLFLAYNLSRQKKVDISLASHESMIKRSSTGVFLKWNAPMFDPQLLKPNSHRETWVTITASGGPTGSVWSGPGQAGWSNYNITAGGDYAVATGIDHHSANYWHLNASTAGDYFASYSATTLDSDAGYDAFVPIGDWSVTTSTPADEAGMLSFYAAMR